MKQIVEVRELLENRVFDASSFVRNDVEFTFSGVLHTRKLTQLNRNVSSQYQGNVIFIGYLIDELLKVVSFEGIRLSPYKPKGERESEYLTIGVGHTFHKSQLSKYSNFTLSDAISLFVEDFVFASKLVAELCREHNIYFENPDGQVSYYVEMKVKGIKPNFILNSNYRKLALIDFVFNCGIDALKNSTLFKYIKEERSCSQICKEFARWKYSGNKVLPGLERRCDYRRELWKK